MVQHYTLLNVSVVLLYFTADLLWSVGPVRTQAASNNVTCQACPKGSMGNTSNPACKDCPHQGWCKSVTACLKCTPGFYQNSTAQTACLPCPQGHYQTDAGQETCLPCPQGHYQKKSGQAKCKICEPGEHQDDPGQVSCVKCGQGFYTGTPGSQKCLSCGYGGYCSKLGCTKCSPCGSGTEATNMGSVECTPCLKGHYKSDISYSVCQTCQKGWYQDKNGQTFCSKCPKGFYCPWPDDPPFRCDPSQVCPAGSTSPETCQGLYLKNADKQKCELSSAVYAIIGVTVTGVFAAVGVVFLRRYRRDNEQKRRLLERQHPVYTGW